MTLDEAGLNEARAVRYFDAARVLHIHMPAKAQYYWEPFNHLLAMSIELTLKAFLMRAGVGARTLKRREIRHSLNALLKLAIDNGLRPSNEAVEPVLHVSQAHYEHSFRYTGNLAPDKVSVIFHAQPKAAIDGVGLLLDQCSPNPVHLRRLAGSNINWPMSKPVEYPITSEQLDRWIEEIKGYQAFIEARGPN